MLLITRPDTPSEDGIETDLCSRNGAQVTAVLKTPYRWPASPPTTRQPIERVMVPWMCHWEIDIDSEEEMYHDRREPYESTNEIYDLASALYHALQGAQPYDKDVQAAGSDQDLAEFFTEREALLASARPRDAS